jgi:hypothetical protein
MTRANRFGAAMAYPGTQPRRRLGLLQANQVDVDPVGEQRRNVQGVTRTGSSRSGWPRSRTSAAVHSSAAYWEAK